MKTNNLITTNPDVELVQPNLERDAKLGVQWLNGPEGHSTLQLMGVADKDNLPTTLQKEEQRVTDFINNPDQLNWMISYKSKIVGSVWADLKATKYLQSPSVHIMLGDPKSRGKGIGTAALEAVIKHLAKQGHSKVYSRYLISNKGSQKLLTKLGFIKDGKSYSDTDGLIWQNVILTTKSNKDYMVLKEANNTNVIFIKNWFNYSAAGNRFINSYEDTAEWVQQIKKYNNREGYVAYIDDEPVGFVDIEFNISTKTAYIAFAIAPQQRGNGYGRQLITKAIDIIKKSDIHKILGGVETDNIPSQKLLTKLGFKTTGQKDGIIDYVLKI